MVDAEWVFVNIVGNIGVALILITYFALTLQKIQSHSILYSLLNMVGAALIGISLIFKFNLPAAIIESSWCLISIIGLVKAVYRTFQRRKRRKDTAVPVSEESPGDSFANRPSTGETQIHEENVAALTCASDKATDRASKV